MKCINNQYPAFDVISLISYITSPENGIECEKSRMLVARIDTDVLKSPNKLRKWSYTDYASRIKMITKIHARDHTVVILYMGQIMFDFYMNDSKSTSKNITNCKFVY